MLKKDIKISIVFLLALFLFACQKEDEILENQLEGEEVVLDSLALEKEEPQFPSRNNWSIEEKMMADSAVNESYLSDVEKQAFYYLNLARMNPPLFAKLYVKPYEGIPNHTKGYAFEERKVSLIEELSKMEPLPLIQPDREMYESAKCFAVEGGKLGLLGHDRTQTECSVKYYAECISYGKVDSSFHIIMAFLIDAGENNEDLGHRRICLKRVKYAMGASMQPHIKHGKNMVLDFKIIK